MSGSISLDRADFLIDEPVSFSIVDCVPGELVTVVANWVIGEQPVQTEARFVAPATGIVEPATLPSVGGTYTGVEPYGLWWSIDLAEDIPDKTDPAEPWPVFITATGATWEATGSLLRRKLSPSVRQVTLQSGRLRGVGFFPAGAGPFPSVLLVAGSTGGLGSAPYTAALLASHGFATLVLAYFNYADLPPYLIDIPLEYFRDGIDWLRTTAPALDDRVAVIGTSRGGELALLLGATFPDEVSAVVAKVPSGIVWAGFAKEPTEGLIPWTRAGRPVVPLRRGPEALADPPVRDGAIVLTPTFEERLALASPADLLAAEIPVEQCGGPVLLLSGEDDAIWPSVALAEIAVKRGQTHGARYPLEHLRYPDAGHAFTLPAGLPVPRIGIHPVMGDRYAYGGTPVGNAHASVRSWHAIMTFLNQNLSMTTGPSHRS